MGKRKVLRKVKETFGIGLDSIKRDLKSNYSKSPVKLRRKLNRLTKTYKKNSLKETKKSWGYCRKLNLGRLY